MHAPRPFSVATRYKETCGFDPSSINLRSYHRFIEIKKANFQAALLSIVGKNG